MKYIPSLLKLIAVVCVSISVTYAQNDSLTNSKKEISISGFIDSYYVFDTDLPKGNSRQNFLFNHNRHNEFNINLGLLKFAIKNKNYRANIALQTGTYAIDNYAAEPGLLKNIFEANVGISLNKKKTIWIDAGVLPSHLGFESAISSDNLTLTRSLLAENSPYFSSGAKVTFSPSKKIEIAGVVMNGWQRIQRVPGNSLLSAGTQLTLKPSENTTINWSTFIGTDDPDSTRRHRYFNNLYGIFKLNDKLSFITAFDIGFQQKQKSGSSYNTWLSPIVIVQFKFNDKWASALRAEYYEDPNGVIIQTNTINGFETSGFSLNLDYSPATNVMCRIEGRWMNSRDAIFGAASNAVSDNLIFGASIAIGFEEKIIAK